MTPTIRNILLPTDFGPSCASAAAYAGMLARGFGASVHLVHVLEAPPVTPRVWHLQAADTAFVRDRRYYECRAKLKALAAATLPLATDRITIEVRTGTPAEAIVAAAVDYGADVIVMSAPARGGRLTLVLGSVAERVSREAPCPVLAVGQSGAARIHARRVA
jgi:nucleotide-binding universal stress UspA family protein